MINSGLLKLQRYSGVAGVFVVWVGIGLAMRRGGIGFIDERPISYLSVNPSTMVLFSGVLLISAFLFVNFAFYVKRTFHAGNRFLAFFLIGQAGQVIAALAHIGSQSRYGQLHTTAAFTLGFSFPFLVCQFTRSQIKNPYYRTYLLLLGFELATFAVGMGLFIFTKGIAPLGEVLTAIGFHIWIIAITYISLKLNFAAAS